MLGREAICGNQRKIFIFHFFKEVRCVVIIIDQRKQPSDAKMVIKEDKFQRIFEKTKSSNKELTLK